jgi:hypothetical protein
MSIKMPGWSKRKLGCMAATIWSSRKKRKTSHDEDKENAPPNMTVEVRKLVLHGMQTVLSTDTVLKMSMGGSRSEKYTSSSQSKSFEPLVLEETDFNMPVDIPDVVFDWENPPQVPQVEQLDGTHEHSVALWAASAAATMALHHVQTDAMILDNEKFIKISAKSNYITAVEHAEHCRAAATIVVNLAEVAKIGADQTPTSVLQAAAAQAAMHAKVEIHTAGNVLMAWGHCKIMLQTTKEWHTATLLCLQDAEAVAVIAIDRMAALEKTNREWDTIGDLECKSELGAVFDHDDVHGGFIDDEMNLMDLSNELSGDPQITPTHRCPSTPHKSYGPPQRTKHKLRLQISA